MHLPLQARAEVIEKYRRRDTGGTDPIYCAMVESAGDSFGRLLAAVDEQGMADRTVVILFRITAGFGSKVAIRNPSPTMLLCVPGRGTYMRAESANCSWCVAGIDSAGKRDRSTRLQCRLLSYALPGGGRFSGQCRRAGHLGGSAGRVHTRPAAVLALPALQQPRRNSERSGPIKASGS